MVDCRGKHDLWSFSAKVTPRVESISSISHWQIMTTPVGGGRPWSRYGCVVFTQHPPEKCRQPLWEAPFFIAWRGSSINVTKRRRGGIPLLCCPGYLLHTGCDKFSASGEQGEVPTGAVALGGYGTLSRNNVWRFKMKMLKSLLLGSAAGLVAVAGAQAADLPVKAKPVEYVKICSLYGVGFYYIPGTDMCIKIGGWVRAEYAWGVNGSSVQTYGANAYLDNRATNNSWWRVRGYITADARNQTEYGTVRGYIAVGISTDDLGNGEQQTFNANRAFIQWAGFTFGRAASFYDFFAGAAVSYFGFYPQSDTGDGGKDVLAYTAQFGNGLSASIAAELPRRTQIIGSTGTSLPPASSAAASVPSQVAAPISNIGYGGFQAPDVVANFRVDQAWGSAQIGAAAHQVNGLYYQQHCRRP